MKEKYLDLLYIETDIHVEYFEKIKIKSVSQKFYFMLCIFFYPFFPNNGMKIKLKSEIPR